MAKAKRAHGQPRQSRWWARRGERLCPIYRLCLWWPHGEEAHLRRLEPWLRAHHFPTLYASTWAFSRSNDAVGLARSTVYCPLASIARTFRSIVGEWWTTSP